MGAWTTAQLRITMQSGMGEAEYRESKGTTTTEYRESKGTTTTPCVRAFEKTELMKSQKKKQEFWKFDKGFTNEKITFLKPNYGIAIEKLAF